LAVALFARQIVCVVGPHCAGKTTAATLLQRLTNFQIVTASSYPKARHERSGSVLPLLDYVTREFELRGKDTFARAMLEDLKRVSKNQEVAGFIIDGFRAVEELQLIKDHLGPCFTLAVYAGDKIRYERNLGRAANIHEYSEFIRRDLTEYDFGLAALMYKFSHQLVLNESDLHDFEDALAVAFQTPKP
jgi:dephospho-CoA kinase